MDTIIPFDWARIFLGDAPPLFLLEIIFRVIVIWLWTAVLLRWIGGRSISQMSIVEFLLVIALGSAVGDALFYPEVPLLHAMLVILLIVLLDKAVDICIRRWPHTKSAIDGQPVEVLRDGVILCDGVKSIQMSTLELMEMLRLRGVENLGSLRLAFLEPSGEVSLFGADKPQPGLCIVPPVELGRLSPPAPGKAACCANCGLVAPRAAPDCPACGGADWTVATDAPPCKLA